MSKACLLLLVLLVTAASASSMRERGGPDTDNVVVHLWEWSWNDVAKECENLGKWGYWAVQVSPPQEDVAASIHWWSRYQPVSYKLVSRSGTEEEFVRMVSECKRHGVGIIVDAVINHMASHGDGYGRGGTHIMSKCSIDGVYSCQHFHHVDCPQGWCGDCESCLNCELYQVPACVGADPRHTYSCNLGGLPDLDTSNAYVQDSIASYLNKLVDLGVVGIRIDAAKHIDPAELDAVLSRVKAPGLHVNQEVMLTGDCQCVHRQDYYRNGKVWEFNTPLLFYDVFHSENMEKIRDMDSANPGGWQCGWAQSELAHTFVVNHDRLVQDHRSTITMLDEGKYRLALITLLAHPYGQPNILSSLNFNPDTWDQVAPTTSAFPDGCGYWRERPAKPFACEHRWPEVRNMVAWRKAAGSAGAEPPFQIYNDKVLAMTRGGNFPGGAQAFVAVNIGASDFSLEVNTNMQAGQYCNVVAQGPGLEDCYPCTAACPYNMSVDGNGRLAVRLGGYQAVAFHKHSRMPAPSPAGTATAAAGSKEAGFVVE